MCKILSILILVIGVSTVLSAGRPCVRELNDKNFIPLVDKIPNSLVKFYAPWCGHCQALAPEFEKAALELRAKRTPMAMLAVDCTVNAKTCDTYKVDSYPTILWLQDGYAVTEFSGERKKDAILKFVQESLVKKDKKI